ncbi:unnamed protein product [Adineta steineri]|uniref:Uncharacterized protein n=1 Tax=Adineta steineri TaxID=433720 RepID=A0A814LK91_9BILA|nr:unnamed protein product [Adineta steineri]
MSNFDLRNSCVSQLGLLFFATNHRNYAPLYAQHLSSMTSISPYPFQTLKNAFAVNRSMTSFKCNIVFLFIIGIALDQSIECSINLHGKSHGLISGKRNNDSIDAWIHSFSFRAVLTDALHEICSIEIS